MKKAWKYTLAAVGLPLLCFGGLALDSYYRALSAIADHDARLAADMADARSGHPPRPANGCSFDDGHSRRYSEKALFIDATILDGRKIASAGGLLEQMKEAQDHLREGGYKAADQRFAFEIGALRRLQGMLNTKRLPSGELRDLSRSLDRIHSGRPTVAEIITGEHLLDRVEVLNVLHRKRDDYPMILRPPGWREFFSWRILIARTLLELDDHNREMLPLASLPLPEAQAAAFPWAAWREKEEVRGRTMLRIAGERTIQNERLLAAEWQFTRLAMALSLFQAEKERDPKDLGELVPDYLPSLPVSPFDGVAYGYRGGQLYDVGLKARWLIAPK